MLLSELLKGKTLVLASKSPRRKELLAQLGLPFVVRTNGDVMEDYPADLTLEQIPEYLALKKAKPLIESLGNHEILITSDTIVCQGQTLMGKPKDRNDAIGMISCLSGSSHLVITGVCIATKELKHTFSSTTKVFFRQLERDEIEYYIDHFKPFDKAGAYGIQEWIGHAAVERIEGSYFNVMGLPVQKLYTELLNLFKNRK